MQLTDLILTIMKSLEKSASQHMKKDSQKRRIWNWLERYMSQGKCSNIKKCQ